MGKFVITTRKNGEFQFNLLATNGQVIGTSQMCANGLNMKKGIASVMKNASEAVVIDQTESCFFFVEVSGIEEEEACSLLLFFIFLSC